MHIIFRSPNEGVEVGIGLGAVRVLRRSNGNDAAIRPGVREILSLQAFEVRGRDVERGVVGGVVEPAQKVIEGSVFEHQDYDVFDFA